MGEQEHWTDQWIINVSPTLRGLVEQFLTTVEEILMTDRPELKYLRIVDKKHSDYQNRLYIFLELNDPLDALKEAVLFAVQEAVESSLAVCSGCGEPLLLRGRGNCTCEACEAEKSKADAAAIAQEFGDAADKKLDVLNMLDKPGDTGETLSDVEKLVELHNEGDEELPKAEANGYLTVRMFDIGQVEKLKELYKSSTKDVTGRISALTEKMRHTKADKRLAAAPASAKYFDGLADKFPNFGDVVEFLRKQAALCRVGDGTLRLPPICLVGDAGIGKTEFLLTLANDLGTSLEIIDVASAQTGSQLSGSEIFWSNASHGKIFEELVFGEVANPIFMLDEIDKVKAPKGDGAGSLSALYKLLEPKHAAKFADLSLPGVFVNASSVIWMATANDISLLDKPLVDRFTVFNVATPSPGQVRTIAQIIYTGLCADKGVAGFFKKKLTGAVLDEISRHHPRKVKKILQSALGLAALSRRKSVSVLDIKVSVTEFDRPKQAMGFLS